MFRFAVLPQGKYAPSLLSESVVHPWETDAEREICRDHSKMSHLGLTRVTGKGRCRVCSENQGIDRYSDVGKPHAFRAVDGHLHVQNQHPKAVENAKKTGRIKDEEIE
jgi:hypothetical protein